MIASLVVAVMLAPGAALADSGPQYGTIGQYGEVWRGGGFDVAAYDHGRYDQPLTPGKFLDPVGFTIDTHDASTTGGTAIYVLDRTSNLPGKVSGSTTSWRLQKLDDTGEVLGTDRFSLPADANHYAMLGLTVDPAAGRVYALVTAFVSRPGITTEYVNEILAWSTQPTSSGQLGAPAALAPDSLSAGLAGYPTPGLLSPFSSISRKNGFPSILLPEGLTLDVSGATHYLAVQSADDTQNGAASGIAQIQTDTGTINKQWSSSALDGLPNGFGDSGDEPAGISTAPDGSLVVLLDEGNGGPSPSDIDTVDVPASLTGKAKILSSAAISVENPDFGSLATDDAPIFTSDAVPQVPDPDGKTPKTLLASPQIVALSDGLYAGEFEPDPVGQPDPQSPDGSAGLWTAHDPGVRLLAPESDGTLSNLTPPLTSLFDTLGNATTNTSGATDPGSACNLSDQTTDRAGQDAVPFPSLAAGANGALWVLTRGSDSAGGTTAKFQGGRELIELAPGGAGAPCPTPSGTFSVAARGGAPKPASTSSPLVVGVGTDVTFDASTIDYLGGATAAYEWDFGDGHGTTTLGANAPPFTWPSPSTSEQYTTVGTYTVTLKLFGDFGEYDETGTIQVVPASTPTASFTYVPAAPRAGSAVSFDASASTPSAGADLVDYQWNWGDGTIDETSSATDIHVYGAPGAYTVKLTVRDTRNGLSAPSSQTVTVGAAPPPPTTTTTPVQLLPPATIGPPDMTARVAARPTRSGKVKVVLACPLGQVSCAGTVLLRTASRHSRTLGKASFTIAGGRIATVYVKLSRRTLATFRRSRSIKVTAIVHATNPEGESGSSYQRLTLHRARPRRSRKVG